jgi:hypothetical protein
MNLATVIAALIPITIVAFLIWAFTLYGNPRERQLARLRRRLARLQGERDLINYLIKDVESIPGGLVKKSIDLAGEIRELEHRIAVLSQRNEP